MNGFQFNSHDKLKPCPFCGCSFNLSFECYLADGWVECLECNAKGPPDFLAQVFREKCEDNAVLLWNERGT